MILGEEVKGSSPFLKKENDYELKISPFIFTLKD